MSKDYDSGLFNKSRNRLPSEPSRLSHIFGVRPGHIKDTPKNRSTLEEVANDESNYIRTDKWEISGMSKNVKMELNIG